MLRFLILSPSYEGGHLSTFLPPTIQQGITCVQCSCSREPIRNSAAKVFIGGDERNGHPDTLCLHGGTKSQIPRQKAGVQHKPHCSHKQSRHSKPILIGWGRVGTQPNPSPQMQAGLSKDSDFRPAVLTLSCTDTNPFSKSIQTQKWLFLTAFYTLCQMIQGLLEKMAL